MENIRCLFLFKEEKEKDAQNTEQLFSSAFYLPVWISYTTAQPVEREKPFVPQQKKNENKSLKSGKMIQHQHPKRSNMVLRVYRQISFLSSDNSGRWCTPGLVNVNTCRSDQMRQPVVSLCFHFFF